MTNKNGISFSELEKEESTSNIVGKLFVEEAIEHAGVKGMRWGVIRSRSARYAAKAEARQNKKGKADLKNMSDADLKSVINRIQLEQQYRKLTTKPTILDKGKDIAGSIVRELAKESGKAIAKSYVTPLMEKAMANKAAAEAASKTAKSLPKPPLPTTPLPKPAGSLPRPVVAPKTKTLPPPLPRPKV